MGESTIYRNLIELPPNFLSKEAFKAGVHERDLLSYAGCIKYPSKGGLWGVHGGIEKLPVLRTKQSKKMTHMISFKSHGESLNEIQNSKQEPCVITSIAIPGNKLEKEKDLLPLIRRNLECARLPECLRPNLFTSHNSKFEVFPRFDLVDSQYGGLSQRTVKQEIGPATQIALDKLSEVLYRKSLYQTDYQPMAPLKDTLINLPGIGRQETSCDPQRPGILSKVLQAMDRKEVKEKERKVEGNDDNENENEMGIEEEGEKETNDDSETTLDWDKSNKDDQSDDDILKEKAKKTKAKWLYEKRNVSTVLPLRSPYQKPLDDGNITKSKIVLPQCYPKSLRNYSGQTPSLEINARPISFDESIVRTKAIQRLALAKKLADTGAPVKLPSMPSKSPEGTATKEMSRDIKLPCLGAMISDLLPQREGNLNQERRNTLPLMIGMRFKTDAHVKFHKAHPEPVPDLRDSIIDGKRHVFFGAHAMLLR